MGGDAQLGDSAQFASASFACDDSSSTSLLEL